MSKQRRFSRPRRWFKSKARSYTHLGIEQLEDRCLLAAHPAMPDAYLPFFSQPNPQPTGVEVLFVEPVGSGPSAAWKPLLETSVYSYYGNAGSPPSAVSVDVADWTTDQSDALGLPDTPTPVYDADSSKLWISVGNELLNLASPSPMDVLAFAPNYSALRLSPGSVLSGQIPALASLGGEDGGAANYDGFIVLNVGTTDPQMSVLNVVNSGLSLVTSGASSQAAAMMNNADGTGYFFLYGSSSADSSAWPTPAADVTDTATAPTSFAQAPAVRTAAPAPLLLRHRRRRQAQSFRPRRLSSPSTAWTTRWRRTNRASCCRHRLRRPARRFKALRRAVSESPARRRTLLRHRRSAALGAVSSRHAGPESQSLAPSNTMS